MNGGVKHDVLDEVTDEMNYEILNQYDDDDDDDGVAFSFSCGLCPLFNPVR